MDMVKRDIITKLYKGIFTFVLDFWKLSNFYLLKRIVYRKSTINIYIYICSMENMVDREIHFTFCPPFYCPYYHSFCFVRSINCSSTPISSVPPFFSLNNVPCIVYRCIAKQRLIKRVPVEEQRKRNNEIARYYMLLNPLNVRLLNPLS